MGMDVAIVAGQQLIDGRLQVLLRARTGFHQGDASGRMWGEDLNEAVAAASAREVTHRGRQIEEPARRHIELDHFTLHLRRNPSFPSLGRSTASPNRSRLDSHVATYPAREE